MPGRRSAARRKSDYDVMPDAWESAHGLDPQDPKHGTGDRHGDGNSNVEEYLNTLVPADGYGRSEFTRRHNRYTRRDPAGPRGVKCR